MYSKTVLVFLAGQSVKRNILIVFSGGCFLLPPSLPFTLLSHTHTHTPVSQPLSVFVTGEVLHVFAHSQTRPLPVFALEPSRFFFFYAPNTVREAALHPLSPLEGFRATLQDNNIKYKLNLYFFSLTFP